MINIDFTYLTQVLVAPRLKRLELILYIQAILTPVSTIHAQFQSFFTQKEYELSWNGQVIMLEELLNLEFDPLLKRIRIDDPEEEYVVYLFNKNEENEPTYLFNKDELQPDVYLRNISEEPVDFLIVVPDDLSYSSDVFNALVKKYKIASKTYNIVTE